MFRDGKAASMPDRSVHALEDMAIRISAGLQRNNCLAIAEEIAAKAAKRT
jgi:hypothetical protein